MPTVLTLGGMGLAVGLTILTLLTIADPLRRDVRAAFAPVPAASPRGIDGMNFVTIFEAPTGVARGTQIGLAALLLGGLPAAVIGRALAAGTSRYRRRWSAAWGSAFLAGFAFQVSSVALSLGLLVLGLAAASDAGATAQDVLPLAGTLLVVAAGGVWGLGGWRALLRAAGDTPETLVPQARLLR